MDPMSKDLWTALVSWGPAIPMLLFFLKAHRDIIYRIVPKGLRTIKECLHESNDLAGARHQETLEAMEAQRTEIKRLRKRIDRTGSECKECARAAAKKRSPRRKKKGPANNARP